MNKLEHGYKGKGMCMFCFKRHPMPFIYKTKKSYMPCAYWCTKYNKECLKAARMCPGNVRK